MTENHDPRRPREASTESGISIGATGHDNKPIIGLVVDPQPPVSQPKLVGVELSFYIGKRIFIALIATIVLTFSLITIKASKSGSEEILTVENRDQPNLILGAFALYLLGVSTDLDLSFPLKMLRGKSDSDDK